MEAGALATFPRRLWKYILALNECGLLHAWPRALETAVLGAEICDSLLAAAVRRRQRFSRETAMADLQTRD
jgi:hypothetical protein